ncbi:MAG: hypothetical protein KIS92_18740 [Planctomycetota bacterium]|nr:hypothetical protein [Planctomycetota bacterium]
MPALPLFPIDPQAGDWRHEILKRSGYSAAVFFLYGMAFCLVLSTPALIRFISWMTFVFVFVGSVPEALLRKSVGLLLIQFVSMSAAYYLLQKMLGYSNSTPLILGAVHGGLWGFFAGLGARSPAGVLLGVSVGILSGYGSSLVSRELWDSWGLSGSSQIRFLPVVTITILVALMRAYPIGIAVWVGARVAPKPPNPPGAPAAPSV